MYRSSEGAPFLYFEMKTKQVLVATVAWSLMLSLSNLFWAELGPIFSISVPLHRYSFPRQNQSSLTRNISDDVQTEKCIRHRNKSSVLFDGQNISTEFEHFYDVDKERLQNSLVNKHEYILSMNNENLCSGKEVFIISFIHSGPSNFEERQIIRESWGSFHRYESKYIQHVFLLGQTKNKTLENKLQYESNFYRDIIQGNFIDSYRNLTYKQILGLYWINKYCSHAEFVIKTDDDVIANIPFIIEFFLKRANSKGTSEMMECRYETIVGPERSERNKWFTTVNEYPPSKFPPYCIGFAYLMSPDVIKKFLEASKTVPFMWIDDVYVGGFLTWVTGVKMHYPNDFCSYHRSEKDLPIRPNKMFYLYYNRTLFKKTWRLAWKTIVSHTKKNLLHKLTISLKINSFLGFI